MWFMPRWCKEWKKFIKITHVSSIGHKWTTYEIFLVEKNQKGKKRAFLIDEKGRRKVSYEFYEELIQRMEKNDETSNV